MLYDATNKIKDWTLTTHGECFWQLLTSKIATNFNKNKFSFCCWKFSELVHFLLHIMHIYNQCGVCSLNHKIVHSICTRNWFKITSFIHCGAQTTTTIVINSQALVCFKALWSSYIKCSTSFVIEWKINEENFHEIS